jgi:ABC-type Zn2+ transport system substrate-binding protein/surface adhesin
VRAARTSQVIPILVSGLRDAPELAALACRAAVFVADQFSNASDSESDEDEEEEVEDEDEYDDDEDDDGEDEEEDEEDDDDEASAPSLLSPYFADLAEALWVAAQRYV